MLWAPHLTFFLVNLFSGGDSHQMLLISIPKAHLLLQITFYHRLSQALLPVKLLLVHVHRHKLLQDINRGMICWCHSSSPGEAGCWHVGPLGNKCSCSVLYCLLISSTKFPQTKGLHLPYVLGNKYYECEIFALSVALTFSFILFANLCVFFLFNLLERPLS